MPAFTIEKMEVDAEADRPVSHLVYQVKVPRYAVKADKRLFVPLNGVHPFTAVPPEADTRRLPVESSRGYTERDTMILHLPEGYQVESMPEEPLEVDGEFGRYRLELIRKEGTLRVHRHLEIFGGQWAPEKYHSYRDFCREVARQESQKLVLVEKRT